MGDDFDWNNDSYMDSLHPVASFWRSWTKHLNFPRRTRSEMNGEQIPEHKVRDQDKKHTWEEVMIGWDKGELRENG